MDLIIKKKILILKLVLVLSSRAYEQTTNNQIHIALTKELGILTILTRINSSQVNNDLLVL
jgi:hypothetical protein